MFSRIVYTWFIIVILIAINGFLLFYFLETSDFQSGKSDLAYPEVQSLVGQNWDFRQLSNFFRDLAQEKGGAYAYRALAYATTSSYIPPNIDTHLLGHVVGDELYKQKGIQGIKDCTDDMRNACSHSIVVGAFLEKGEPAFKEAAEICKEAPGGKGAYTMCVHGLGHGVLAFVEYDMKKAVKMCDGIGDPKNGDQVYLECIGGITMEMMAGVNDEEAWRKQKPNYFKENDPLAPCNMSFMPKVARPMCYTFLTPHLFEAAGASMGRPLPEDFKKAFTLCDRIPSSEPQSRRSCYGSFGKEFVVLVNERNVQSVEAMSQEQLKKIYDWCILAERSDGILPCIQSAMQSLYWGGENDRSAAVRFCSLMTDRGHQEYCVGDLIGAVSYYIDDPNYRKEFCGEIPQAYQEQCKSKLL